MEIERKIKTDKPDIVVKDYKREIEIGKMWHIKTTNMPEIGKGQINISTRLLLVPANMKYKTMHFVEQNKYIVSFLYIKCNRLDIIKVRHNTHRFVPNAVFFMRPHSLTYYLGNKHL